MTVAVAYVRIEGLLAGDEETPVIVEDAGRVLDCNKPAARAGVRPGQALRAAYWCCPEAAVRTYDPVRTRERREGFCQELYAHTPQVEPDGPSAAFLSLALQDAGGPAGAAAGTGGAEAVRRAWIRRCTAVARRLLPGYGHRLDLGLASGKLTARIAADLLVSGRGTLAAGVPGPLAGACVERLPVEGGRAQLLLVQEEPARFLAPLPVRRLWPLQPETLERLERFGLQRIGDIARMPPEELRVLFPPDRAAEALTARRLAAGVDPRPVEARYPPPHCRAERRFPEPVPDSRAWRSALKELARELSHALAEREELAGELALVLPGESSTRLRLRSFPRPAGGTETLYHAAGRLLERDPPGEALTGLVLEARRLVPAAPRQAGLWDGPVLRREVEETLLRLAARWPAGTLRLGGDLVSSRRERLLAVWDPFRRTAWPGA